MWPGDEATREVVSSRWREGSKIMVVGGGGGTIHVSVEGSLWMVVCSPPHLELTLLVMCWGTQTQFLWVLVFEMFAGRCKNTILGTR